MAWRGTLKEIRIHFRSWMIYLMTSKGQKLADNFWNFTKLWALNDKTCALCSMSNQLGLICEYTYNEQDKWPHSTPKAYFKEFRELNHDNLPWVQAEQLWCLSAGMCGKQVLFCSCVWRVKYVLVDIAQIWHSIQRLGEEELGERE